MSIEPNADQAEGKANLLKPSNIAITPRIAFLGFCRRVAQIQGGLPDFWEWSFQGLTNRFLFHVFPAALRGFWIALSVHAPKSGENFNVVFRETRGKNWFNTVLSITDKGGVHEATAPEEKSSPPRLGWIVTAAKLETAVTIVKPGEYEVLLETPETEICLGTVSFRHQPVPPFTPEDIAAIKSDPFAIKFVRLRFACSNCGDALKTYAGIERSERSEKEGWIWSANLPERFTCKCGKAEIDLSYARTGLHGLLRRRLSPLKDSDIEAERQYERTALEMRCREFRGLISNDVREERIQQFLTENPVFFARFTPFRLFTKPPILTHFVADFAILNEKQELLLIEIERPGLPLIKVRGGVRAELTHAVNQVQQWLQVFDDHRAAAMDCLDLELNEVATVRGVVIAGRTPEKSNLERLLRSHKWGNVEFLTFDDLESSVTEIVRHIAAV